MAIGTTITTLGLGSNGVLNNDLIDQLKAADKKGFVDPIARKKDLAQKKQDELGVISNLVSTLSDSISAMNSSDMYQSVLSEVSGDSVSVETSTGAKAGEYSLEVTQLATKDIFESNDGFDSKDASLDSGDFTISIDGSDYTINIEDGDTLSDLVDKINSQTDGKVEASILNVGGDDPYKLIVKSSDTGEKNRISISTDSDSFSNDLDRVGDPAQDAKFKLDGVEVTRSSNTVDDLIDDVTFTLNSTGTSKVTLTEDTQKIVDSIEKFVNDYNNLANKIVADTKYDPDTKNAGLFQGDREVRDIKNDLRDVMESVISKDGKRMGDFGLEFQKDGTLSFDKSKFEEAYKADPKVTTEFFKSSDVESGFFEKLDKAVYQIGTKSDGVLKSLKNNYDEEIKRLTEEYTEAQKRLDTKYDILTQQFASYDRIMGQLSTQAATLDSIINPAGSKDK